MKEENRTTTLLFLNSIISGKQECDAACDSCEWKQECDIALNITKNNKYLATVLIHRWKERTMQKILERSLQIDN